MLPFREIPSGSQFRVPGVYAELDSSQANTAQTPLRALIVGQITAGGLATPNVPLVSAGVQDARAQGGVGSMLAGMTAAYNQADPFGEVWYLPLADAEGAVAATGTITITGSPTAAGTISLYIAGNLSYYGQPGAIAVPVTVGESASSIATAVAAAVNALTDLPVSASDAVGVVTITANNKGLAGNDIDLRVNYGGTQAGEATPAGITVAIAPMAGGATNPTLTTALANLGDMPFDFIATPYTDATSIAALTAFLNNLTGRWSWESQLYGGVYMAVRGGFSSLVTFGATMNDAHTANMGFFDSPSPNWAWAACIAGVVAVSVRADPSQPIAGLAGALLPGILPPPAQSQFNTSLRNTLLFDGVSTYKVIAGQVFIENLITTYQTNSNGQPDNSYLQVETLNELAFLLRDLVAFLVANFGRAKLAANGTRAAPGTGVVTPSTISAAIVAHYGQLEAQGEAQNTAGFAAGLIVQINAQNPSRVDVLFDPTLMQGLRIFAVLAQFRLM
jgi:phage tail sheath gpL-like